MLPYVTLFGKEVTSYWLMAVVGIVVIMLVGVVRCKRQKIDWNNHLYFLTFCLLGMLIGAKVLAWVTSIPYIIAHLSEIFASYESFMSFLGTGFVFYGGLLGAMAGVVVYRCFFQENVLPYLNISVVDIPIFHFFGRIGCFCAGCCYGIESQRFGIAFTNSPWSPNGIKFLPVQLIEAGGNLVILAILLWYEHKPRKPLQNVGVYLVCYSVMRFILEFFRGDAGRGAFLVLSTSQWISCVLFPLGLYFLLGKKQRLIRFLEGQKNTIS